MSRLSVRSLRPKTQRQRSTAVLSSSVPSSISWSYFKPIETHKFNPQSNSDSFPYPHRTSLHPVVKTTTSSSPVRTMPLPISRPSSTRSMMFGKGLSEGTIPYIKVDIPIWIVFHAWASLLLTLGLLLCLGVNAVSHLQIGRAHV